MENPSSTDKKEVLKIMLVSPDNYYSCQFTVEAGYACVIGRADTQSAFYPVVDLSDLGAYRMGVSRMHATLELIDKKLIITDHSSNGTEVDGILMRKGEKRLVENHSSIKLGELTFHVVIQS